MAATQQAPNPADAVVSWMTADGRITVVDCAECPYQGQLCQTCIVPALESTGLAEYDGATARLAPRRARLCMAPIPSRWLRLLPAWGLYRLATRRRKAA